MTRTLVLLTALSLGLGACAGTVRAPATYRDDTQRLLETRSDQLKRCYDAALATDPTLAGKVTVQFKVQQKTGVISDVTVDPSTASAPRPLIDCLLQAFDGLMLEPPDVNEGQATFTYEFTPTPAAPAPSA